MKNTFKIILAALISTSILASYTIIHCEHKSGRAFGEVTVLYDKEKGESYSSISVLEKRTSYKLSVINANIDLKNPFGEIVSYYVNETSKTNTEFLIKITKNLSYDPQKSISPNYFDSYVYFKSARKEFLRSKHFKCMIKEMRLGVK
ncbi:MAG: hypothetical protein BM556_15430 [Bacteriovorax sp. MedPE-SWde]|nr:MAG: hypothetical protein BM556_15430 [Bacteriovorax sp. MedPE-SWde]